MIRVVKRGQADEQLQTVVYIGRSGPRPSVLANQWSHLPPGKSYARYHVATREAAISAYQDWLGGAMGSDAAVRAEMERLIGIYRMHGTLTLVCHCAPLGCHGDVLKSLIERIVSADGSNEHGTERLNYHPATTTPSGSERAFPQDEAL